MQTKGGKKATKKIYKYLHFDHEFSSESQGNCKIMQCGLNSLVSHLCFQCLLHPGIPLNSTWLRILPFPSKNPYLSSACFPDNLHHFTVSILFLFSPFSSVCFSGLFLSYLLLPSDVAPVCCESRGCHFTEPWKGMRLHAAVSSFWCCIV